MRIVETGGAHHRLRLQGKKRSPKTALYVCDQVTLEHNRLISGDFLVFDGEGMNGKPGYTFEVSATDGGPAGSAQDTILVQFYGPNSFTYNAPATIAGGDVVVHE